MNTEVMGPGRKSERWPLVLFAIPLVVELPIVAYGALRLFRGDTGGRLLLPVWGLAVLAVLATLAGLLTRSGRATVLRQRLRILALFVLGGGSLVAADLALTLTGVVPTVQALRQNALEYERGTYTRLQLVPGQRKVIGGIPVHINARGLRGEEVAVVAPAGRVRILLLGGSQVFDLEGDFPARVGVLMREAGHDVEILNGAVPGHQTADSLGRYLADLWLLKPDLVVFCQCWNDLKYSTRLGPHRPLREIILPYDGEWALRPRGLDALLCYSALWRQVRLRVLSVAQDLEFQGELRATHDTGTAPRGVAKDAAFDQYSLNVATLARAVQSRGATFVLCLQPRLATADLPEASRERIRYDYTGLDHKGLVSAFARCDVILQETAAALAAPLLTPGRVLDGRDEFFSDHIHFTPAGSEVMAQEVAAQLAPLLGR